MRSPSSSNSANKGEQEKPLEHIDSLPTVMGLIDTFSSRWALSESSEALWSSIDASQRVLTNVVLPVPEAPGIVNTYCSVLLIYQILTDHHNSKLDTLHFIPTTCCYWHVSILLQLAGTAMSMVRQRGWGGIQGKFQLYINFEGSTIPDVLM